jgi:hypothetical protein
LKLGDRVKFSKYLSKQTWYADKETSKEFCDIAGIKFVESNLYKVGGHIPMCSWFGHKLENKLEGIICGCRNIGVKVHTDEFQCDGIEKTFKVYLIATNMRGFHRVPLEWIELVDKC